MIKKDEIISVGKFQKTHALKGELNIILDIDPLYFKEGNPIIIEDEGIYVPYYVESVRPKGNTSYLIKIDGIDTEEEASRFVNKEVSMLRKDASEWIEEGEDEIEDLIGYKVINAENDAILGSVSAIDDSTSNVILIVEQEDESELYLPFNEDLIEEIDDDNQVIRMKIPDGLLEINLKQD